MIIKKVTKKLYQQELEDFKKLNPDSIVLDHVSGCFFTKNCPCLDDWDGIIIISDAPPYYQKILTLYHEIGHHQCHKTQCRCRCRDKNKLSEEHADIYMLEKCLEKSILPSLKMGINILKNRTINPSSYVLDHIIAASQEVIKTKLYKDCVKFVNINS